jgi:hypothetical protein
MAFFYTSRHEANVKVLPLLRPWQFKAMTSQVGVLGSDVAGYELKQRSMVWEKDLITLFLSSLRTFL